MSCLSAVLMFMLCGLAIIHICHARKFLDPIEKVGVIREDLQIIHRRQPVSWHVLPLKKHNNKGRRGIIEFEPSSDEGALKPSTIEGSGSSAISIDNEVDSRNQNNKRGHHDDDDVIDVMDYNPAHSNSPIHNK